MSNSHDGVLERPQGVGVLGTRSGRRTGAVTAGSADSGWKTRTGSSPGFGDDATHGWALVAVNPRAPAISGDGAGGAVDSGDGMDGDEHRSGG